MTGLGTPRMCDNRNSNRMSSVDETHQLIDSCDIKQEPDIKEEPHPVGELNEFPALDYGGDGQSTVNRNQFGNESESVNLSIDKVKSVVKKENDESPRSNNQFTKRNEDATDNYRGHSSGRRAQQQQPNRNDGSARNSVTSTKCNARPKALQQNQCKHCEYNARCKSHLEKHLLKHTDERPFPCIHCEKAFKSKLSLNSHMKVHINDFLFNCAICLKGFDQKNVKMEHEINCKTLRYECHLCNKSFGSMKSNLIQHMRIHSGEKPFECKECSIQFKRKSSLNQHMQSHAGPCSFRCSNCHRRFSQEDEMISHQQKCNRPAYECYVCGKSFGSHKVDLNKHMRTHTGDKPFECSQCQARFTQKIHLNVHMIIHSRSLPWKCAICRQGFAKQTQWKAHQLKCHRRNYECFDCKKFFGSQCTSLKDHMTKHSGERAFRCEECGKRFIQKGYLTRHMKNIHNKKR